MSELIQLTEEIESLAEIAHNTFIRARLDEAIDNNRDIWRELRQLGLLPTPRSDLHGFSPDDLNTYFAGVSTSFTENIEETSELIDSASSSGFSFTEVTLNDVILAVAHFSSQATGSDGIPQKIIAKALPSLGPHLVKLFNASLIGGSFPSAWKKSLLVAIERPLLHTYHQTFALLLFYASFQKFLKS